MEVGPLKVSTSSNNIVPCPARSKNSLGDGGAVLMLVMLEVWKGVEMALIAYGTIPLQ